MKVEFTGKKLPLSLKCVVKKAFKHTLKELEQTNKLSICVNIVTPEEIREINKQTREIDKVTDVLSFPSFEISPFDKVTAVSSSNTFLGDMAICMEEVEKQQEEYSESKKRVLARLVIHSVLHMLGFDHIKDEDYAVMEPVQNKILNRVVKK